jgi:hypothetical protein
MNPLINETVIVDDADDNRKINFLYSVCDLFKTKFIIVDDQSIIENLKKNNISGIFLSGLTGLDKHFTEYDDQKLVIIYNLTKELSENTSFKYLLSNGKKINVTMVILNFDQDILHKIQLSIDIFIFSTNTNSKSVYDKYFTKYPPYYVFEDNLKILSNEFSDEHEHYLLYIKNSRIFLSATDRFHKIIFYKKNDSDIIRIEI